MIDRTSPRSAWSGSLAAGVSVCPLAPLTCCDGRELVADRCDLETFAAEVFEPHGWVDAGGNGPSAGPVAAGTAQVGGTDGRPPGRGRQPASPGELHHHQPVGRGACPRLPRLTDAACDRPTALVIDDTGFLEDGDAPACVGPAVHRQRGQGHHLPRQDAPAPGLRRRVGCCRMASVPARELGSRLVQGRSMSVLPRRTAGPRTTRRHPRRARPVPPRRPACPRRPGRGPARLGVPHHPGDR